MIDGIPDWVMWVLLMFAAGVIGQFGKSLTLKFLDLFSSEEAKPAESAAEPTASEPALSAKDQKKLQKAEAKRAKKEAKVQAKQKG